MHDLNNLLFTLLIYVGSFAAGLLGSLTGLGGGVIVVPMLTGFQCLPYCLAWMFILLPVPL